MDNVTIWYKVARPEFFYEVFYVTQYSLYLDSHLLSCLKASPYIQSPLIIISPCLFTKIDSLYNWEGLRSEIVSNTHTHTHTRAHTAAHIPYSTSKLILSLWQPYIAKHKQQSQNQTGGRQLSLSIVAHSYANTKWGTTLCLCEFIAAVRCMVKGSDSNPDLDEAPVREIMSITCVPNPESVPYRSNICRTCRL